MRKFFVQNIFFLILVNLVVKPLWIFGIDRNVQNFVGHADYGQYQALLNFTIIFQIFLDFGLQSFNNREVAQRPESMTRIFPNIIWAKIFLSGGYLLLLFLFGLSLGFKGYNLILLGLLGIMQIFSSLLLFLRSNVSGMHRFKTDSILSVLDKLIMLLLCGALLYLPPWKYHFKIEWFIYAQIIAYFISSGVALLVCLRLGKISWQRFDFTGTFEIIKRSLPFALLIFSMSIYLRADSVMMKVMLPNGDEAAGVYAASFRLLDVANNMTGVLFAGILLPLFGRLIAQKHPIRPIVRQSINLLLPVAFTTVALCVFFGDSIMHLLYTAADEQSGLILMVLMFSFPGFCIGYVYSTLLTANGNLWTLIYVSVIGILVNLGMNIYLLPQYGALGAAWACAVTQVVISLLNIWLCCRFLHLKTAWRWIGQYLLFCLFIAVIGYSLSLTSISLFMKTFSMGIGAIIGMGICGFIPFSKLSEWIQNWKTTD